MRKNHRSASARPPPQSELELEQFQEVSLANGVPLSCLATSSGPGRYGFGIRSVALIIALPLAM